LKLPRRGALVSRCLIQALASAATAALKSKLYFAPSMAWTMASAAAPGFRPLSRERPPGEEGEGQPQQRALLHGEQAAGAFKAA